MKSSGNSSATASPGPRSSSTPQAGTSRPERGARRTFALTGPSIRLDPTTHAVRGDLADIRLADLVFAPHYAEPMTCRLCWATPLLDRAGGTAVGELTKDDRFELLELAGGHGWGAAPRLGLVGYCDRRALELT